MLIILGLVERMTLFWQTKKNAGKNVRPSQLLFSQKPEIRLALLERRLPGLLLPWCFFSILTIHFPNRHAANSNETQSSEKPFR